MPLLAVIRYACLASICVSQYSPTAQAQSSPRAASSCAPTVTCDEFKELTGKKVFPKVIIDDVTFDGSLSLPPAILDALRRELTSNEFDGDPRWLDGIMEVPVRATWQDNGYYKVDVSARTIPRGGDENFQHFSVIVHVDEGLQYRIGDVTFRSADPDEPLAFPTEDLRNLLPFRPGDLSDASKIRQGLDALIKMYQSKGYIDFTATPETEVDDDHQILSIHFALEQLDQYRIRRITVCGSNSTFEDLMKSKITPGDIFSYSDIQGFFDEHRSALGPHFGSENVQYKRDIKNHSVDIFVSLRNCTPVQE